MRRTYLLCLTWVLIAGVGLAKDFWTKKEYMQWTDEEVKKVMTNSPWAKDVTVSAPMALLGAAEASAARPVRSPAAQTLRTPAAAVADVEGAADEAEAAQVTTAAGRPPRPSSLSMFRGGAPC